MTELGPQLGGAEPAAGPPPVDTAEPPPPVLVEPEPAPAAFTSPDKIRSVIDRLFNGPESPDRGVRLAVQAGKWIVRTGMAKPVIALFPPLDDAEQWDAWLALGVGIALNLLSDGVELRVDESRAAGAAILQDFFA